MYGGPDDGRPPVSLPEHVLGLTDALLSRDGPWAEEFVAALRALGPDERAEAVRRARTALVGRPDELPAGEKDSLVALGSALSAASAPGGGRRGARLLLAILRDDPAHRQGLTELCDALRRLPLDEARPLKEEALRLTHWSPRLLLQENEKGGDDVSPAPVLPGAFPLGSCGCGGSYERRQVFVRFTRPDGQLVELGDVPQGVCTSCASRVYRAHLLNTIDSLMAGRPAPRP